MPLRLKGNTPKAGEPDKRYYMIDVQEGQRRVRLSSGTRNRSLAEQKEQAVLDALRADLEVSDDVLRALIRGQARAALLTTTARQKSRTWKDAFTDALADRNGWGSLTSVSSLRTNCRQLALALGDDFPVSRIDQAKTNELIDTLLARGNSKTTVNRKLYVLLYVLRREKKAGRYPAEVPEYKPFDEREFTRNFVMSPDDEAMLFHRVEAWDRLPDGPEGGHPRVRDGHHYRDLFVFLVDVGCRLSQAFKVRWADLEVDEGTTFVRFWRSGEQKGGKQRTTPCTARVVAVLAGRKALGWEGPFARLKKRRAQVLWDHAKSGTHLEHEPDAVIHSLRHTCATRLLRATRDIKLVQEWLGHTALKTTEGIYAKVLVDHKRSALEAFEKVLSSPRGRSPAP